MMLAIDLPPELEARLTVLAERTGLSTADHVRRAVIEHLDAVEDAADAEQVLDDIRSGRSRVTGLEEVERELGLAG